MVKGKEKGENKMLVLYHWHEYEPILLILVMANHDVVYDLVLSSKKVGSMVCLGLWHSPLVLRCRGFQVI